MRYAMLIIDTEAGQDVPQGERDDWYKRIFAWYEGPNGKKTLPGGAELQGQETARTLRGTTVTDGPFVESKEVIGGVDFIDADSIDEAAAIAATWPGVAEGWIVMELRPVVEH